MAIGKQNGCLIDLETGGELCLNGQCRVGRFKISKDPLIQIFGYEVFGMSEQF